MAFVVADYAEALERQAELAQMFATNLTKNRGTIDELLTDIGAVKGPKDKPLKPVTTTVYSVDR